MKPGFDVMENMSDNPRATYRSCVMVEGREIVFNRTIGCNLYVGTKMMIRVDA